MACIFCDTDFIQFTPMSITRVMDAVRGAECVVLTGGEPLIQPGIFELIERLARVKKSITIETNGTIPYPPEMLKSNVHISLSPKVPEHELKIHDCLSLKVLYPYLSPAHTAQGYAKIVTAYEKFIQPIDKRGVVDYQGAMEEVVRLGADWRLGPQLHKLIGVK
jgi:organic radical activating enzyme